MTDAQARVFDAEWNELDRGPLKDVARRLGCRHAYVTSDGRCMHCNADLTPQLTAAAERLTAAIDYALAHSPHSPSAGHPCTGIGVGISTDPAPATRHGGLPSLRTTSSHGGV